MFHPIWQWLGESGNQKLLLGILIAFVIGLLAEKLFRRNRQEKIGLVKSKGDKAFLKGVQYILSNDRDQAIEEFTKSVQLNSDTIETYVALGNLYRSKGDIDRAVRIRQNIILRPNIDERMKLRALFDLGLDYRKGGFLNRSLKAFFEVIRRTPSDVKTLEEIERIYEELKDWANAFATRKKIARLVKGDHQHILSHHLVEMGKACQEKGDLGRATTFLGKAIATHAECIDAYLHLGDIQFSKGEYKKAISTWKKVATVAPQFTFLAYRRLEGAYARMKNLKPVEEFLKECAESNPDAFTFLALARYLYNEKDVNGALAEIDHALELEPSFWEARKFKGEILLAQGREKEALGDYGDLIQHLNMPYLRFQCSQCGFEPKELLWQCPQCNKWDTIGLIESGREGPISAPQSNDVTPALSENLK